MYYSAPLSPIDQARFGAFPLFWRRSVLLPRTMFIHLSYLVTPQKEIASGQIRGTSSQVWITTTSSSALGISPVQLLSMIVVQSGVVLLKKYCLVQKWVTIIYFGFQKMNTWFCHSICNDEVSNSNGKFVLAYNTRVVACFLGRRCGDCEKDFLTASTFSGLLGVLEGPESGDYNPFKDRKTIMDEVISIEIEYYYVYVGADGRLTLFKTRFHNTRK